MKKLSIIVLLVVSMAMAFSACNNSTSNSTKVESKSTEKIVYTCTMHPEVHKDKPGDCPICGMPLVIQGNADSLHMHNQSDTMHMMH